MNARAALLVLVLAAAIIAPSPVHADPVAGAAPRVLAERVDRVRASLLIMEPGGDFFSCTGHAALRIEGGDPCADLCYSYESEPYGFLLARFLAGGLKMGMFRVPVARFLEPYADEKRGARAFRLDLPPGMVRELRLVLDEKAAEGIELPYDYLSRGCAQSVLRCICAAAERCGKKLAFPVDRPYYHLTCRETFGRSIPDWPWTFFFLYLVAGTDADLGGGPPLSHIHVPADLLDLLRATTCDGAPVLPGEAVDLMPPGVPVERSLVTPLAVAILIFLVSVLGAIWPMCGYGRRVSFVFSRVSSVIAWTLFAAIGGVTAYVVFFTHLPGTTWNWLLVPFDPLCAVFWRWRRRWAVPHCLFVATWTLLMFFAPHRLTDPAYLLLAFACLPPVVFAPPGRKIGARKSANRFT